MRMAEKSGAIQEGDSCEAAMQRGETRRGRGCRNPILPLTEYIPDGEPKRFGDRVYLYGSKDLFGGEYCCHKYHVYSAPVDDLSAWTDHGVSFASTGEYEGVPDGVDWSDALLYAPDVAERDGVYYLYFCLSDGSEGVAESLSPTGPFTNARRITMGGRPISGIDPSVLRDGNDFYYTWGQGKCHMARLMDDMCTLEESTYVDALISNRDEGEGFHEGSSLRKIGAWYVLVYASEHTQRYPNHGAAPVCLDYAVSKSVYGPYERRGTIIDNTGIDPQSWNNHGSILKIGDQWYVFYHGSTNNSRYARRARVERIEVDEQAGLIKTARMTSSGFAPSLDPREALDAACAYRLWGGAYFTERDGAFPLVNIKNSAAAAYRYFDFGVGQRWTLKICFEMVSGGTLTVLANGEEAAKCELQGAQAQVPLGQLSGLQDVKLVFSAPHGEEIIRLHSLCFAPERS